MKKRVKDFVEWVRNHNINEQTVKIALALEKITLDASASVIFERMVAKCLQSQR